MNRLVHYLKKIEAYRHPKGKRHQLLPSLIIRRMALTCGYTGLRAMARVAQIYRDWLKEYRPRPRGKAPSCPTLQRRKSKESLAIKLFIVSMSG
jgi:hypothetical protein